MTQGIGSADLVIAMARATAPFGGVYSSHIRDESNYTIGVVAAVLGALLVAGADLPALAILGVVMATAIGLVDDARPQPASVRVVALAVAGVPIAVGLPLGELGPPARVGVVVLLLLLANAVNLIDGQDGLAGGLGAIASVGLAAVIAANGADAERLGGGPAGVLGEERRRKREHGRHPSSLR
jgi:UDP-N-acetylmuramyl pentapeptide phosphotransferase/UDP-N-acetylglucosamine-1-phosphate transferase